MVPNQSPNPEFTPNQNWKGTSMKRNIAVITGLAGLLLLALATPSFADEKGKEVTITGEGKCAKCILKETDKCQNAIQTTEDGKKVTYYLADNEVSKNFHEDLCKEAKKVTATGTVKEVDGKKELTVTKIEVATK
jgi:hypothetical protein